MQKKPLNEIFKKKPKPPIVEKILFGESKQKLCRLVLPKVKNEI